MKSERATRSSWKNLPLPSQRARLPVQREYTVAEYQQIARGFIPQQMEDKWFIFLEGDWLHMHRSWTGVCVFKVRFREHDGGYAIAEVWVNRDPEQYGGTHDAFDGALLLFIVDRLLLGYDASFPDHPSVPSDQQPLGRWSLVGDARFRDEPVPERFSWHVRPKDQA
jgi:hypothetical protein